MWWFVQDATKILAYRWLKAYNIFGINETGAVVLKQSTLDYQEAQRNEEKNPLLGGDNH